MEDTEGESKNWFLFYTRGEVGVEWGIPIFGEWQQMDCLIDLSSMSVGQSGYVRDGDDSRRSTDMPLLSLTADMQETVFFHVCVYSSNN